MWSHDRTHIENWNRPLGAVSIWIHRLTSIGVPKLNRGLTTVLSLTWESPFVEGRFLCWDGAQIVINEQHQSYLPVSTCAASSPPFLSLEGLRNFRIITYNMNSCNQRISVINHSEPLNISLCHYGAPCVIMLFRTAIYWVNYVLLASSMTVLFKCKVECPLS